MPACHKCGKALSAELDYGRQDTCSTCGFATRVCLNCSHYDRSQYNECSEPVADRVVDKEKANFCDYFNPSEKSGKNTVNAREQALNAAEALFKKSK